MGLSFDMSLPNCSILKLNVSAPVSSIFKTDFSTADKDEEVIDIDPSELSW